MDDDELMAPEQRALLRAVVDAIADGSDVYAPAWISPRPPRDDVDAVLRILNLAPVGFQSGETGEIVLARVLDLLEAVAAGEDITPANDGDGHY